MSSPTNASGEQLLAAVQPQHAPKRRVTQGTINKMAELRRQGMSYLEIGARLGCSERTARRFVGQVVPHLELPQAEPESGAQDPDRMRGWLARHFSDQLYHDKSFPEPRLSVTFLAESAHLVEERLEALPELTLELLMKDKDLRVRFLRESVGTLYSDFSSSVRFGVGLCRLDPSEAARQWARDRELPERPAPDDDGSAEF